MRGAKNASTTSSSSWFVDDHPWQSQEQLKPQEVNNTREAVPADGGGRVLAGRPVPYGPSTHPPAPWTMEGRLFSPSARLPGKDRGCSVVTPPDRAVVGPHGRPQEGSARVAGALPPPPPTTPSTNPHQDRSLSGCGAHLHVARTPAAADHVSPPTPRPPGRRLKASEPSRVACSICTRPQERILDPACSDFL